MCGEISASLERLGFENRHGLADTPGAAWALARFASEGQRIAASGSMCKALGPLPVEALRIASADVRMLHRLGLKTVEALDRLPRSALDRRFSGEDGRSSVLSCLDRALGRISEPVSPLMPVPVHVRRLAFPEPIQDRDQLRLALDRLINEVMSSMEKDCSGARRLVLWCFRVDGETQSLEMETVKATRDCAHLLHLFDQRLDAVNAGPGIDLVALHAVHVEVLKEQQLSLTGRDPTGRDVSRLLDRLQAHLGNGTVRRLERVERYLPEKAERVVPADVTSFSWRERPALACRPFRLLDRPEPVEVMAATPDGPPLHFVWRRRRYRVVRAAGPERIEPEWWAGDGGNLVRDYYRVEDGAGHRYWIYRAGHYGDVQAGVMPCWYLHGFFG